MMIMESDSAKRKRLLTAQMVEEASAIVSRHQEDDPDEDPMGWTVVCVDADGETSLYGVYAFDALALAAQWAARFSVDVNRGLDEPEWRVHVHPVFPID